MKNISDFKNWLHESEHHLGTISGGAAQKVLDFVEKQQNEIDELKQKLKRAKNKNKVNN